jgi:hypothetical protein
MQVVNFLLFTANKRRKLKILVFFNSVLHYREKCDFKCSYSVEKFNLVSEVFNFYIFIDPYMILSVNVSILKLFFMLREEKKVVGT